jgi:hypothetical protein
MLNFISHPDYRQACRDLSTIVRDFERTRAKREGMSLPFMEAGCIPRPESEASLVSQCLGSMELRGLNVGTAKLALGERFKATPWFTQLWKLLSVLEEMERLASER